MPLALLIAHRSGLVELTLFDCELLGHPQFPRSLCGRPAVSLTSGAGAFDAAPQLIDTEPELVDGFCGRRVGHTDQREQQIAEVGARLGSRSARISSPSGLSTTGRPSSHPGSIAGPGPLESGSSVSGRGEPVRTITSSRKWSRSTSKPRRICTATPSSSRSSPSRMCSVAMKSCSSDSASRGAISSTFIAFGVNEIGPELGASREPTTVSTCARTRSTVTPCD